MKREEIKSLIPDISEENLNAIMQANGADIEEAKRKSADELKKAKDDLTEARNSISTLEKAKGDADALQAEIDRYKAADEKREREAAAAAAREAVKARLDAVLGERKFASEYTEKGVIAEFEKLISDKANIGKGDAELFDSLTKDKPGIFASKNPPANMGGFKHQDNENLDKLSDAEYYNIIFRKDK